MSDNPHHEHLVKEVADLFAPILSKSPQAIYIYLDDEHKICNQKFSDMLEYSSVQAWVDNQAPLSDVVKEDQEKVVNAYMNASRNFIGSTLEVMLQTKTDKTLKSEIIFVPFTYRDETFVVHFISQK